VVQHERVSRQLSCIRPTYICGAGRAGKNTCVTYIVRAPEGVRITNRQRFLTLSSLVEGLKYKVTGSKMSIISDDLIFAEGVSSLNIELRI